MVDTFLARLGIAIQGLLGVCLVRLEWNQQDRLKHASRRQMCCVLGPLCPLIHLVSGVVCDLFCICGTADMCHAVFQLTRSVVLFSFKDMLAFPSLKIPFLVSFLGGLCYLRASS